MAKKRDTGKGTAYDGQEEAALARAVLAAYAAWDKAAEPTKIDVRAQVEWAGHVMSANNGKRRTRVDVPAGGMRKVREALEKLKAAGAKAETARPSSSYKAKSWHAKLNELVSVKRGSEAADRAGLNPSRRTLEKWLSDQDYPIRKGDRERIDKAYDELRNWRVTEAKDQEAKANHEVSAALTDALRDKYGQTVRFRDIDDFRFE